MGLLAALSASIPCVNDVDENGRRRTAMRRLVILVTVLALATPAFAAESGFNVFLGRKFLSKGDGSAIKAFSSQ